MVSFGLNNLACGLNNLPFSIFGAINWVKLGMSMILPAAEGKTIIFPLVCFQIILFLKQESRFRARRLFYSDSQAWYSYTRTGL